MCQNPFRLRASRTGLRGPPSGPNNPYIEDVAWATLFPVGALLNEGKGWWRANWRTAVSLALIFAIALFLRFYFVYGLAFPAGIYSGGADYSGGSDSFYWERAIKYTFDTGRDLGQDVTLNYPLTMPNPRPPLFAWFSVLMGRLIAPLIGDAWQGVVFVFLASTGLFGGLTIFPTYLLTKEAFGRRAGLVAALLLAISAAHLQRSQATDADHDAFTLFFVVSTFYFYLRSLRTLTLRRWVDSWSKGASIRAGLRAFFRENPKSILYALLSGLCITAIALSWQGWAYVPVILLALFAVELFLDRLRNQDTMAVTILFTIVLLTPLLLALPWYLERNQVRVWFDVPAYLFLVALVLGIVFTITRDYPWTLVVPSTIIAGGVGLVIGVLVNPALANAFVSGAGYFVQTKVVSTIAEAQAPGLSQLILSFGWFTFFFSLAAVAYMLWQIPRRHDPSYTMIAVWVFASIFMAMSAARFIFNGSPAFAVAAAYAIDQLLIRADFAGMRRSYRSLVEGSWRNAIRKSVKARHVATVILLIVIVLLPNVWFGIDAAIPYELKRTYDRQVNDLLPSFLRAPGYSQAGTGGSFYFGAFGYSLPQPTEYYPAAWRWFSAQDADVPLEERPAFLSWWDYGFEAVDRGGHPTVADNFQNGVAFAGQFITAQSETDAIALLALRLIEGDVRARGSTFSPAVEQVLRNFGLPVNEFLGAYMRRIDMPRIISENPEAYGTWDAQIEPANAQFIYLTRRLTSLLSADEIVEFYRAVRGATGEEIGYFAVDARLFPISVSNTGIFYAPVKLSDHRVINLPDGRVLPYEFFQIFVDTSRASRLPIQYVQPGDTVTSQTIEYQPMFYASMFYRAYVGYSPTDLGSTDKGIPGFSQALQASPPMPAWNLSHFRVAYRTAYYNPFTDVANHTDAWRAMNYADAQELQEDISAGRATGVVDLSTQASITNGVVFLRYYDGAWVNGTLTAAGETPLSGVRITVADELGTPHYVTKTDAAGRYSVLVPFGDVVLTASVGTVNNRTLIGATVLTSTTIPVTLDQAMRVNEDLNADGIVDWIIRKDLTIPGRMLRGAAYFDVNRDGAFNAGDIIVPGATARLSRTDMPFERTFATSADGTFSVGPLPDGTYRLEVTAQGRTITAANVTVSSASEPRQDLPVPFTHLFGFAATRDLADVTDATIRIRDETNGAVFETTTSETGLYELQPLLAGNYTITGEKGELAAIPHRFQATQGNAYANLSFVPSGHVTGVTRLFGTTIPFATLDFQAASDPRTMRTATSDGSGAFDITLPEGEWDVNGRIYYGGALYASLGRVSVRAGETTSYNPIFLDGVRIEGATTSAALGGSPTQATVTFLTPAAEWRVQSGTDGNYLAFLPAGTYSVHGFSTSAGFVDTLSLASSRRLNLSLAQGTSVTGVVYRDMDGNGLVDLNEGIVGARVALTDDQGHSILAVTNESESFSLVGFSDRTYSGTISAPGYVTRLLTSVSADALRSGSPWALDPVPVPVTGSVLLDGSPFFQRSLTVRASAVGGGAVTATNRTDWNGNFALALRPGTYELVVDENVSTSGDFRYQTLRADRISVEVGSGGILHDLAIVVRTRVIGDVTIAGNRTSGRLTFSGPDRTSVDANASGFTVYLQIGNYTVSATGSLGTETYGRIEDVAVSGPANLTFALERATQVTGRLTSGGSSVPLALPITFIRAEGGTVDVAATDQGTYTAYLVPGTYQASVNATANETEAGVPRYVRYAGSASLVIPPGTTSTALNLDLVRTLDNTTVQGTVTLDGIGVDAALSFLARGDGAISANATSATDGTYTVGLAPGSYDLYAVRALGSAAYLRTIKVPHAASRIVDVPLEPGFLLSGVVTDPFGARSTASLTIASGARIELSTDASGGYGALLPAGPYTVTATRSATERGISVQYRASRSLDLRSDTVANLPLEKVVLHEAKLTWDASQRRTIAGGDSVTYLVEVANQGTVEDTFVFTGVQGWTFTFIPSTVTLDFGTSGNRATVSVTIEAPEDALVEHAPIFVYAATPDGVTRGNVEVRMDIERTRAISLSVEPASATFDGRYLNYTIAIANRGNARENVTLQIGNPDDLSAAGWSARLSTADGSRSGLRIEDVSVLANATSRVRLQAQSAGGPAGATLVVLGFASDAPGVSSSLVQTLSLPALQDPGGVRATGPLVLSEPPLNVELIAIVAAAGAAVAAGLFLTRKRR